MRKSLIAVLVLLLALALVVPAVADTQVDMYENDKLVKSVVFKLGVKEYFVDNQVPGVKTDAAPFIENSRTYVPVRFLSNALGVTNENIAWDNPRVMLAEPGFPAVEMAIGSKTIKSNSEGLKMDVSPLIRDSRTFLPARFVAEALGYEVDWDAANQIVTCWPKGTEKPDIRAVVDHLKKQEPVEPVEPVEPTGPTKNIAGYTVPVDTEMKVEPCLPDSGYELSICLMVHKPLEPQYADTQTILSSKFDSQTVDAVMGYIKGKTERLQTLAPKEFRAMGKTIDVRSSPANYFIQVLID